MDKSARNPDDSETLFHGPRRRSSFYAALVFGVLPVWSITPLSYGLVAYHLYNGKLWTTAWPMRITFAFALCEVLFSIHHYTLARSISGASTIPHGEYSQLETTFKRILQVGLSPDPDGGFDEESLDSRSNTPDDRVVTLDPQDPRAIEFRHALRPWFNKVPWSSIRRKEMDAWIYWSVFNAQIPAEIPPARQAVLDDVLAMINRRSGRTVPEGSSGVTPLLLTVDPLNVRSRPLGWYMFVAGLNWVLRSRLRTKWSVCFQSYHGLEYLLRLPEKWDRASGPRPIVLLHGLGLGLVQYELFIAHLLRTLPDVPLLVPIQPHISQNIFHPRFLKPLNRQETSECLSGLLQELGWVDAAKSTDTSNSKRAPSPGKGVTVLSHSNGSFVHAWMLKDYSRIISRSCFVDPVAFCTWEGDVCYNFLYRKPTNALELLMSYFVASELGVANVLQRQFDWCSNSLWCEEIPGVRDPRRNMFFLGGQDSILNAARVRTYLRSHGVREGLWYDPEGIHGQALLAGGKGHDAVLKWLQEGA